MLLKRKGFVALIAVFLILVSVQIINENNVRTYPPQERRDISDLLLKEDFSEEDYDALLMQTGLGKEAICDFKKTDSFKEIMLLFQEQFFEETEVDCEFIFPTTKEETLKGGKRINIPPLKDGDILITKATHTLGWRHGHAAIVTDAETGETLEAVTYGCESSFQNVKKWEKYPSLLILRAKDEEIAKKAAEFAKNKLVGVDYGLFVGLLSKDKQDMKAIDTTHCSHLVWQAYKAAGMDIDGSGWLVLPSDIAADYDLEVIFAYGFDPKNRK